MITLTKATALRIQAEQVAHYTQCYGPDVARLVAEATTADALEDGTAYPAHIINRHIPRGVAIEWLIPAKREQEAASLLNLKEQS